MWVLSSVWEEVEENNRAFANPQNKRTPKLSTETHYVAQQAKLKKVV